MREKLNFAFLVIALVYMLRLFTLKSYDIIYDTGRLKKKKTENVVKYEVDVKGIIKKWTLNSSKVAENLLLKVYYRDIYYDPQRDFLHLNHLHKTGGTSFSELLQKVFKNKVLPGSRKSGPVHLDEAQDAISQGTSDFTVSYGHESLRPTTGPRKTRLATFLQENYPEKKLRCVTMLREPVNLRASNLAMWVCGWNGALDDHNKDREGNGLPPQCGTDIDFSSLMDKRRDKRCGANGTAVLGRFQRECQKFKDGLDPYKKCRAVKNFLESDEYDKLFHNMYKCLMGRYIENVPIAPMIGKYLQKSDPIEDSATTEMVEQYALEDLGSVKAFVGEDSNEREADFVWFGITERMPESMCLFFYTFKLKYEKVGTSRVMGCRPSSWWTQEERDIVKDREPLDSAVFRAANAIMDVRLAKMHNEIKKRLKSGATLKSMPYVGPGCFVQN